MAETESRKEQRDYNLDIWVSWCNETLRRGEEEKKGREGEITKKIVSLRMQRVIDIWFDFVGSCRRELKDMKKI